MTKTTENRGDEAGVATRAARPLRRVALIGAMAAAGLSLLLSGCSAASTPEPDPSATAEVEAPAVDDDALGLALVKLAFQGDAVEVADDGACLVDAVRDAGVSEKGLAYIIEADSDDLGAVASGLLEVEKRDANVLLSPQLRTAFDGCVDEVVLNSADVVDPETTYEAAAQVVAPPQPAPNLTPTVAVDPNRDLNSATQLTQGVASMFSSYALNEDQAKIYTTASECLGRAIFDAGFSQDAMRFIAGGAPIGSGAIADFLPTDEDQELWASEAFTLTMVDCTTRAKVPEE